MRVRIYARSEPVTICSPASCMECCRTTLKLNLHQREIDGDIKRVQAGLFVEEIVPHSRRCGGLYTVKMYNTTTCIWAKWIRLSGWKSVKNSDRCVPDTGYATYNRKTFVDVELPVSCLPA